VLCFSLARSTIIGQQQQLLKHKVTCFYYFLASIP
jgi:hypothetical protein